MNKTSVSPVRLAQIFIFVAVLGGLAASSAWVWGQHQRMAQLLGEIAAKHARLQGILNADAPIRAAHDALAAQISASVYPADMDVTRAGNDAQQRINAIFTAAQLSINSIQVLPPEGDGPDVEQIPINVQVEGAPDAIALALQVLVVGELGKPRLLVRSTQMQSVGAVRPNEPLRMSGRFQFVAVRVKA